MRTIRIQNSQWSLEHCSVLCIVQFAALFAQKCDHVPPYPPPLAISPLLSGRFPLGGGGGGGQS